MHDRDSLRTAMGPMLNLLRYLWAGPTTALGLLFVALGLVSGGRAQVVDGERAVHGGLVRWRFQPRTFISGGAAALTLGHVVLARDEETHHATRRHERVHVRQCERWGPFFLPAYLLGSLLAWIRGGRPYRDNPFEREAYENE